MTQQQRITRILITRDEKAKAWVAECVDYDLVTQAKRREDIYKAFGHVFFGTILVALEKGQTPAFLPANPSVRKAWGKAVDAGVVSHIVPSSEFVPKWWPKALLKLSRVPEFCQPNELVAAGA